MILKTETIENKEKFLIVSQNFPRLVAKLKHYLGKTNNEFFSSPQLPQQFDQFNYIFLINPDHHDLTKVNKQGKNVNALFINKKKKLSRVLKAIKKNKLDNFKIIILNSDNINSRQIESIFWFALSSTKEKILQIQSIKPPLHIHKNKQALSQLRFKLNKKNVLLTGIVIFLTYNLSFICLLILSGLLNLKSLTNLYRNGKQQSFRYHSVAKELTQTANFLYSPLKPIYPFISLSLFADNLLSLNKNGLKLYNQASSIQKNSQTLTKLFLKKNKTTAAIDLTKLKINQLTKDVNQLEKTITVVREQLPKHPSLIANYSNKLAQEESIIAIAKKILPQLGYFLGENKERSFLFLFTNNMELRPGGGFVGSFAVVKTANYELKDVKIYDVYDADGQLKVHIKPPKPIAEYLHQPNWFLRDSAFSPDFVKNYAKAKSFLEKEMGFTNFSGGIMITTTAVKNILQAFGNVYLTDYRETINKDNFYIKTQIHAENNFFPGSIEKKGFLSSLVHHLIINLKTADQKVLLSKIKTSLDEKQIVAYFDNSTVQKIFDNHFWSGRFIYPKCENRNLTCFSDFFFPVDANLGVNKANFFINKLINLGTKISPQGQVNHFISIKITNQSPSDVFPGGNYKDYFQAYLPLEAEIKTITKNGVLVKNFDQDSDRLKRIGFLIIVKPRSSVEIKINYSLKSKLPKGHFLYQLIVQKQIGTPNSDLVFELKLNNNLRVSNQNFNALVKENRIIYNTSLSADKIFLLEFTNK